MSVVHIRVAAVANKLAGAPANRGARGAPTEVTHAVFRFAGAPAEVEQQAYHYV